MQFLLQSLPLVLWHMMIYGLVVEQEILGTLRNSPLDHQLGQLPALQQVVKCVLCNQPKTKCGEKQREREKLGWGWGCGGRREMHLMTVFGFISQPFVFPSLISSVSCYCKNFTNIHIIISRRTPTLKNGSCLFIEFES